MSDKENRPDGRSLCNSYEIMPKLFSIDYKNCFQVAVSLIITKHSFTQNIYNNKLTHTGVTKID